MTHELIDVLEVNAPIEDAWEFFSQPANLPKSTPKWLGLRILSPEPETHRGALIDYQIRWLGLGIPWQSMIVENRAPYLISYLQVRGPYAMWFHEHRLRRTEEGGTLCYDRAVYRLPGGPLGSIVHHLVVKHQLRGIFHHRRKYIDKLLGLRRASSPIVTVRRLEGSSTCPWKDEEESSCESAPNLL